MIVSRATLATLVAASVAIAAVLIAAVAIADTPPVPPARLDVPGEQVLSGSSYIFTGPDGAQYHVYGQTNLIIPSPTPSPTPMPVPSPTPSSSPVPTPSPTPSPTPTPAPVVTPYDDGAFTYFGTGWGVYTAPAGCTANCKYGGSDHFTHNSGDSYGFLFTGTGVVIYSQTAPWMAIASFSVDGGVAAEFDAYAASATQQVAAFRSGPLAPGVHRIIVRNTGRMNPAATTLANGGGQVTADRADITDGALVPPLAP